MTKGYNLLKSTVSHLQVMDDPKKLCANDIGLLAIIGLLIVGTFEAIGALILGNSALIFLPCSSKTYKRMWLANRI